MTDDEKDKWKQQVNARYEEGLIKQQQESAQNNPIDSVRNLQQFVNTNLNSNNSLLKNIIIKEKVNNNESFYNKARIVKISDMSEDEKK